MFLLARPSPAAVARFLELSADLPLSYGPVGVLETVDAGRLDVAVEPLGHGIETFARARHALAEWRHFELGWVEAWPRPASTEIGSVVAVLIRHLGFWSLNGCRIVSRCDERDRCGYTYGTLPNHAEAGEEAFEVTLDPVTAAVTYRIRATSSPRAPLAWLGQPYVRHLQARFRRDSCLAMRRAVGALGLVPRDGAGA